MYISVEGILLFVPNSDDICDVVSTYLIKLFGRWSYVRIYNRTTIVPYYRAFPVYELEGGCPSTSWTLAKGNMIQNELYKGRSLGYAGRIVYSFQNPMNELCQFIHHKVWHLEHAPMSRFQRAHRGSVGSQRDGFCPHIIVEHKWLACTIYEARW